MYSSVYDFSDQKSSQYTNLTIDKGLTSTVFVANAALSQLSYRPKISLLSSYLEWLYVIGLLYGFGRVHLHLFGERSCHYTAAGPRRERTSIVSILEQVACD